MVNRIGHYVLSVVAFGDVPPKLVRGQRLAVSYLEWVFVVKRPDLSCGGLYFPPTREKKRRYFRLLKPAPWAMPGMGASRIPK